MCAAKAPAATARVAVTAYTAACAAVSHGSRYSYYGGGVYIGGAGRSGGGRRVSTPAVVEDVPVANTAAATTPTTVPTAAAAGAAPSSVAARAAVPAAGIASPSLSSTLLALTTTHPAPLVLLLTSDTQAAIADASLAVSDAACSGVWGFARVLRLEHGGMQAWRADVTCGTDDVPLLRVRSLCGAVTSSVVQGCVGAFLCPCLAMLVRWLAVGTQSVAVLGCVRLRCWSRVRQVLSGVLHAVQA